MTTYIVKYCLRDDCRHTLQLDQTFDNPTDAINASLELETDPEVYTSWYEVIEK